MALFGIFSKEKKESLDKGLEKSKQSFFSKLGRAVVGKSKVDDEVLDELEEILIASDVGVETTVKVIERIEQRVAKDKYLDTEELNRILREETASLLAENNTEDYDDFRINENQKPYVILVVGVNGVGKTTTIGKLAHKFTQAGKSVFLGAADTFRAAAVDQLILWGERVGVPVISHGMNTDPASVAYDAVKQGVDSNADIVIIDTAGRLHTKVNLMNELSKIKKVVQKFIAEAPHEVLLVWMAVQGKMHLFRRKKFTKATEVTSLAITKLDGTAKGESSLAISDQFKIPVKYIGVGEKMDDLQLFNKMEFVDSFFNQ